MSQVVINTPVAFIGTFYMDFLNLLGNMFVLGSSGAQITRSPLVVSGTSHMKPFTG
jgi:hypothetical protein